MTSKRSAWTGIAIAFGVAALSAAAVAEQFKSRNAGGKRVALASTAQGEHADAFALRVGFDPVGTGEDDAWHEMIANKLTAAKLAPPEWRIRHYSAFNAEWYPRILGWQGVIANAVVVPNGILVDVRVTPDLGMTRDSHYVVERYLIGTEGVRFVNADSNSTPGFLFGL